MLPLHPLGNLSAMAISPRQSWLSRVLGWSRRQPSTAAASPAATGSDGPDEEQPEPFNPVRRREIVQWALAQAPAHSVVHQLHLDALQALETLGLECSLPNETPTQRAMGPNMEAQLECRDILFDKHTGNVVQLASTMALTMAEGHLGAGTYRVALERLGANSGQVLCEAVLGQSPPIVDSGRVQTVVERLTAALDALPNHRAWEISELTVFGERVVQALADGH